MVETTIHSPTDSRLLGDGVRVLTRLVQRAKPLVAEQLGGVRDVFRRRTRSMQRSLQALYRHVRHRGEAAAQAAIEQRRQLYVKLIGITEQTIQQARRVRQVLTQVGAAPLPRQRRPAAWERRGAELDRFLPLVEQVVRQARTRVLEGGKVAPQEKVVSLFEPHTRVLQREKPGAPVEFGRHLVLDEVEGGLITRYRLLSAGEGERHELERAVIHHRAVFGHPPHLVAADRGFHVPGQDVAFQQAGVKHVAVPGRGKAAPERRALEHSRAWRRHYRWRAGIEGRMHVLRRDFGLKRCRDHGEGGMERWVGWGLMASNLWQIGQSCSKRAA